jgi:hypothetical protein
MNKNEGHRGVKNAGFSSTDAVLWHVVRGRFIAILAIEQNVFAITLRPTNKIDQIFE